MALEKYQKLVPVVVEAEKLTGNLTIGGNVVAKAGDWRVVSGSGEQFIMTDADFTAGYSPVPLQ